MSAEKKRDTSSRIDSYYGLASGEVVAMTISSDSLERYRDIARDTGFRIVVVAKTGETYKFLVKRHNPEHNHGEGRNVFGSGDYMRESMRLERRCIGVAIVRPEGEEDHQAFYEEMQRTHSIK